MNAPPLPAAIRSNDIEIDGCSAGGKSLSFAAELKQQPFGEYLVPSMFGNTYLRPRTLWQLWGVMSDSESDAPDPRAELEEQGYDIIYKPHEVMAEYNAFYRVEYEGEEIAPPAARRMGVPLNEIWLTELLRPYERYVLYHELNEIRYRAQGYSVEEAHERAVADDKIWQGDPRFEELQTEINVVPAERVVAVPGFGEALFEQIVQHRPYCDMCELLAVPGIGEQRYERLCEAFWCFDCEL